MDKNGQHGCFTPSILSIVVCTFVRYKILLQKAHVICKIINVLNDAKLAHTNVRAFKNTAGYSERSSILTESEKHPPYKVFDYSVKTYFYTPLKNFMDNPPTHNKKEKHTSPCLFSHNKGMNTMICVLQPPFPSLFRDSLLLNIMYSCCHSVFSARESEVFGCLHVLHECLHVLHECIMFTLAQICQQQASSKQAKITCTRGKKDQKKGLCDVYI